jgi:2-haloacid dehalogenase
MTPGEQDGGDGAWMAGVRAVVLDCYGTLADFAEQDFITAFEEICSESSLTVGGRELWDRWLEQGRELARERGRDPQDPLAGPEPSFATLASIWLPQFALTFRALGETADAERARDYIVEKLAKATCYPEIPSVLEQLGRRFRLAVLSNADDDFLRTCLVRNRLEFEQIVSSESARSYKPRARIFHAIYGLLGLSAEQILYVGDSPIGDVLGARSAGMPVAWVNRSGVALPERIPAPQLELRDLSQLPRLLDAALCQTTPRRRRR